MKRLYRAATALAASLAVGLTVHAGARLTRAGGGSSGSSLAASDNINFTGIDTFQSSTTFKGTVAISSGVTLSGSAGTSGQYYTSGGSGVVPTWTTAGSGSANYALIASSVIAVAGSFDFNSIDQTHDDLLLDVCGRSTLPIESDLLLTYNGDTTNGDYITRFGYSQGGFGHVETLTRVVTYVTLVTASSYQRSCISILIKNYAEASYTKTAYTRADMVYDDSNIYNGFGSFLWVGNTQPAPAITRIQATISGGLFGPGSVATLYTVDYTP